MASNPRQTGRAAASAASKTLRSGTATPAQKSAAGSALAQTGNRDQTGRAAASAASATLRSSSATKSQKSAAASALSQTPSRKK